MIKLIKIHIDSKILYQYIILDRSMNFQIMNRKKMK